MRLDKHARFGTEQLQGWKITGRQIEVFHSFANISCRLASKRQCQVEWRIPLNPVNFHMSERPLLSLQVSCLSIGCGTVFIDSVRPRLTFTSSLKHECYDRKVWFSNCIPRSSCFICLSIPWWANQFLPGPYATYPEVFLGCFLSGECV